MPTRKIARSVHEAARDKARAIAKTEAYAVSRRERKKVEMLFAHLKRILRLDRLRLRGPSGAKEEFLLAATAQNLRKLAKLIPFCAALHPARAVADEVRPARIVSINMCTDELLLRLVDRDRIASVTWLSQDGRNANMAEVAATIPANHGLAEEVGLLSSRSRARGRLHDANDGPALERDWVESDGVRRAENHRWRAPADSRRRKGDWRGREGRSLVAR